MQYDYDIGDVGMKTESLEIEKAYDSGDRVTVCWEDGCRGGYCPRSGCPGRAFLTLLVPALFVHLLHRRQPGSIASRRGLS